MTHTPSHVPFWNQGVTVGFLAKVAKLKKLQLLNRKHTS